MADDEFGDRNFVSYYSDDEHNDNEEEYDALNQETFGSDYRFDEDSKWEEGNEEQLVVAKEKLDESLEAQDNVHRVIASVLDDEDSPGAAGSGSQNVGTSVTGSHLSNWFRTSGSGQEPKNIEKKILTLEEIEEPLLRQQAERNRGQVPITNAARSNAPDDGIPRYTILSRNQALPNQQMRFTVGGMPVDHLMNSNNLPVEYLPPPGAQMRPTNVRNSTILPSPHMNTPPLPQYQGCRPKEPRMRAPRNGYHMRPQLPMNPEIPMAHMGPFAQPMPSLLPPHQFRPGNRQPHMPMMPPPPPMMGHTGYRGIPQMTSAQGHHPHFPPRPVLGHGPSHVNLPSSHYGPVRHQNEAATAHPYDEYAGLMTESDKNFILRIQMATLKAPEQSDYYYRVQEERQRGVRPQPQRHPKTENSAPGHANVYTPVQFENSLGRLQVGSVNAPRKIIDMKRVGEGSEANNLQWERHDRPKTKENLVLIEEMYVKVLSADDAQARQSHMNAEEAKKNLNEKKKDLSEYVAAHVTKTRSLLTVNKGKHLFARILLYVVPEYDVIFEEFLKELKLIGDSYMENYLQTLPHIRNYFSRASDMKIIVLVEKYEAKYLLNNKFTISVATNLINRAFSFNLENSYIYTIWRKFLSGLVKVVKEKEAAVTPNKPVNIPVPVVRLDYETFAKHLAAMKVCYPKHERLLMSTFCTNEGQQKPN